jgi:2',5'-phosphodiesterase
MPCAFWAPKVMTIHSALAAQRMEKFADNAPLFLCGDWNFKPHDPQFKMFTEGHLPNTDAAHPGVAFEGDKWEPKLRRPMQSAYTAVNSAEPAFTNYGYTKVRT